MAGWLHVVEPSAGGSLLSDREPLALRPLSSRTVARAAEDLDSELH